MSLTFTDGLPPLRPRPDAWGQVRMWRRGLFVSLLLALGVAIKAPILAVERLTVAPRRPISPWVTVWTCRAVLGAMGVPWRAVGRIADPPVALLANHSSWLDIFALNAVGPLVFVSKAEVAAWPVLGFLARLTGTLFIRRDRPGEVGGQALAVARRLDRSERVVIFPEGTTSDGRRVLPFKPALIEAARGRAVQPVTIRWTAPPGVDPTIFAWHGTDTFRPHLAAVLALPRGGSVEVTLHAPIAGGDRKAVARLAERAVRAGF